MLEYNDTMVFPRGFAHFSDATPLELKFGAQQAESSWDANNRPVVDQPGPEMLDPEVTRSAFAEPEQQQVLEILEATGGLWITLQVASRT